MASNEGGVAIGRTYSYYDYQDPSAYYAVNNVSVRWDAAGTPHRLLNVSTTGDQNAVNAQAVALNAAGVEVGFTSLNRSTPTAENPNATTSLGSRGLRWAAGSDAAVQLNGLGADPNGVETVFVNAIDGAGNAYGTATRYASSSGRTETRAVRWAAGSTTAVELGRLPPVDYPQDYPYTSIVYAANAAGLSVGSSTLFYTPSSRATLWYADGTAFDLNTLLAAESGWTLRSARGISDDNWISGFGDFDPDGPGGQAAYSRAFLIQLPEPTSLAALAGGALALLRRRRRAVAAAAVVALSASGADAATFSTLASFDYATTGRNPRGTLAIDPAGNLYGATQDGGATGYGTLFRYDVAAGSLVTLASFDGTNGFGQFGGVTRDANGNLYGTSYQTLDANGGVFRLDAGANAITSLAKFTYSNSAYQNGGVPLAGVTRAPSGDLYGTATRGGPSGDYGTVYKVAAGANALSVVAAFDGNFASPTGVSPTGGLAIDAAGNLYGTTRFTAGGAGSPSGSSGYGTVFRIAAGTNAITTLHTFNSADGAYPDTAVTLDAAGNLYGTTWAGGAGGAGTVFKIDAATGAFATIAELATIGSYRPNEVIVDAAGNLFGTTQGIGGSDAGAIFRIDAGTGTIAKLFDFLVEGYNGGASNPRPGGLTVDAAGNLYGLAGGGARGDGTIFKLADAGFVVPEPTSLLAALVVTTVVGSRRRRLRIATGARLRSLS